MTMLKEDIYIAPSAGDETNPVDQSDNNGSTTTVSKRRGVVPPTRRILKTGISKNWKIASWVLVGLGGVFMLTGGHFIGKAVVNKIRIEALNKDKQTLNQTVTNQGATIGDLENKLDEAKKPTTVVFDENQISQVSSALIANKGIPGRFTGLRAQHFDVETNVLTLYFDGVEGGKEVVYSTQIKFKDSKFTSEDAKLALEEQKPMCQIYKSVEEFKLNAGVYDAAKQTSLVKISSAMDDSSTEIITIDDIKMEITISRNSARKTAKVSYKALLVDGDKLSVVDEGVISVDYNITDAEANSIVVQNFVKTYGAQASAQMIEDEEM